MKDIDTYGAMFAGFWSLEFLDGIFGLIFLVVSSITITYKLVKMILQDIKGK